MYPYINTSMLRERFVITETNPEKAKKKEPVIALGNRMVVNLKTTDGKISEHLIVRGQNMHCVARTAARIYLDFEKKGPFFEDISEHDWEGIWKNACSAYEREYNPQNWVAIYYRGRPIFMDGEHHPFLDVMEQCDAANRDEYDQAVAMAEDIFKKAGKAVKIEKDTNIAAVINVSDNKARCGLILRAAHKSSTFSFSVDAFKTATALKPSPQMCLSIGAAFLESIQLAFKSGQLSAMSKAYDMSKTAPEYLQAERAKRRIGQLNSQIRSYESRFDIRYRPDRPDVFSLLEDTEHRFYDMYLEKIREEAGEDEVFVE